MATGVLAPELSTSWHLAAQRRQTILLALLAILGSLLSAYRVLVLQIAQPILLLAIVALVATIREPRVGLYAIVGMCILFEVGIADDLMEPGRFFLFGLQNTLGLTGLIVSPLEMLLIVGLGSWLARGLMARRLDFRRTALDLPMLLFAAALLSGLVRGAIGGGIPYIAFWEMRSLLYIPACYLLASQRFQTGGQARTLVSIVLVAGSLYAFEGTYRKLWLIDRGQMGDIKEIWYGHDTMVFVVTLVLLVVAQQIFGAPFWQRLLGLTSAPFALFVMLASERRAANIALMITFLALCLVLLAAHRKAFFLFAVPVLVAGAFYLPIFWNDTSMLDQPARAVRSLSSPDPRDAASNFTRELEKGNIRATIAANPLLGVGFGREYLIVSYVPGLEGFPLWRFEPNNTVMWLWLKLGAIGFVLFWLLIGTAITRAAQLAKTVREAQTFAVLTLTGIISVLVFSYVDLGMTAGRLTSFLGILIGMLAALERTPEAVPAVPSTARSLDVRWAS